MGIIDFLGKQKDEPRLHEIRPPIVEERPQFHFDPKKEITESDWQGMKQLLDSKRKNKNWRGFPEIALYMTILAAHRAEITRDGQIKITLRPPQTDFHEQIEPRPVRRRY